MTQYNCARTACQVAVFTETPETVYKIWNEPSTGMPRLYCRACGAGIVKHNPTIKHVITDSGKLTPGWAARDCEPSPAEHKLPVMEQYRYLAFAGLNPGHAYQMELELALARIAQVCLCYVPRRTYIMEPSDNGVEAHDSWTRRYEELKAASFKRAVKLHQTGATNTLLDALNEEYAQLAAGNPPISHAPPGWDTV